MNRISLAALTGALAISTVALAIDVASAAPREGAYRGGANRVGAGRVGVNRVGVNRVGVNRVGVNRVGVDRVGVGYGRGIGYGRGALAYRGGYYRPGLGLAAGAVVGAAAANYGYYGNSGYGYGNSGYGYGNTGYGYGNSGYGAYASAAYDADDTYILRGNYISEADAVAYCAQQFRSYDIESRTFLAYSGERVSCPQQ
jgi:hypothetical protein